MLLLLYANDQTRQTNTKSTKIKKTKRPNQPNEHILVQNTHNVTKTQQVNVIIVCIHAPSLHPSPSISASTTSQIVAESRSIRVLLARDKRDRSR